MSFLSKSSMFFRPLVRHKLLYVQLPLHLKGIPENFACLLIYHMEIRMSCQHFDRTICKELSPILTKNITSKRLFAVKSLNMIK